MNNVDRTQRTRRVAIAALSLAGFTALVHSTSTSARKKVDDKKARKRCRSQIGQFQAQVKDANPGCEDDPDCQARLACSGAVGRVTND